VALVESMHKGNGAHSSSFSTVCLTGISRMGVKVTTHPF